MPKLLAVPNIEKFAYLVREQRKLYQCEEEETAAEVSQAKDEASETSDDTGLPKVNKMKEYQTAALRLHNGSLGLRRLIKVDNELRTPITKEELVSEVARQLGICIFPENLHLPSPLTTVGEYEVPLRLPRGIPRPEGTLQWTLKVKVRRKRSGDDPTFKSPSSDKIVAEAVPS